MTIYRLLSPFLLLSSLLALSSSAQADTLTGRLVDVLGNPIVNGDVDAFDIVKDDDIDLTGDATDSNGDFSISIDPGLYDITLQGPPGSTLVSSVIQNLLIVGTTDVGTIVLEQGYTLSGRVLDTLGFPVVNLDLDVINKNTGLDVPLSGGRTDTFGLYSILVPGNIELRFDPRTAMGPTLAPLALDLLLVADTNIGDVVLQPGLFVTGTLLNSLGGPVVGADLDFTHFATGEQALTLSDNSDASGNFSVVVAAGTWDIEVCPAAGQALVGREFSGVPIATDASVGIHTLLDGIALFGTIFDGGLPAAGVDVDVNDSVTGERIALCSDNSDANGAYSVLAPAGVFDVRFSNATGLSVHANLNIQTALQLDTVLTPCPPASGVVRNGSGVNPVTLFYLDPPRIGKNFRAILDCTGHAPSLAALLLNSAPHSGLNTIYGQLLVSGASIFSIGTAHAGDVVTLDAAIPPNVSLCGRPGFMQALIFGSPGPQFSNAVDLIVGS